MRVAIFFSLIIFAKFSFAQNNKTYDYTNIDLGNSCNVFSSSLQQTVNIDGSPHKAHAGGVSKSGTAGPLNLTINPANGASTAFVIEYPFVSNKDYVIKVTCRGNSNLKIKTSVVVDLSNFNTNGTNLCAVDPNANYNLGTIGNIDNQTTTSYATYSSTQFSTPATPSYSKLLVWTSGGSPGLSIDVLQISKIEIIQTPKTSYLINSNLYTTTCGVGDNVNLSIVSTGSLAGITNVSWNLGTTPNGWIYNGNPAPQVINTGINLNLPLATTCSQIPSQISAVVTANGSNFNTNIFGLAINQPTITLQQIGSTFCNLSNSYQIQGAIPCNAVINWSISPAGIASLSNTTGTTTTVNRIGQNNGQVNLTATITSNCNTVVRTQNIDVGIEKNITLTPNTTDCFSMNVSANTPIGASLTWTADFGSLIDGNASPYVTTANPVTLTSPGANADYIRVSYTSGGCKYESATNLNFCPCPTWDNSSYVTWYNAAPANGEPISLEISGGGVAGAQYYKWFVNGTEIAQTSFPSLFTYNWICVDPGNVTCKGYTYNPNCNGEVESLEFYCGSYSPICYYYRAASNISMYPNPATTETIIKLEDIDKKYKTSLTSINRIRIMTKTGIVVNTLNNLKANKQFRLNVSGLKDDLYFILISDGKNEVRLPLTIHR